MPIIIIPIIIIVAVLILGYTKASPKSQWM